MPSVMDFIRMVRDWPVICNSSMKAVPSMKAAMTSRRNGVIELRKAGLSYAAIGRRLNISRERARQIGEGEPSPRKASGVMLTTSGVAQLLGVHPNTVRHWANKGILKSCRIGPRGDRRFRREDVNVLDYAEGLGLLAKE